MATFEDLLREHRVPMAPEGHHHARHGWIQLDCPFCSPGSSRWRLGYNTKGKYLNCWTCGYHSLVETLSKVTRLSYRQVKELIGGVAKEKAAEEESKRGKLVLPKGLGPLLPAHIAYLKKRRYDIEEVTRLWGAKGIGLAARLQWRVWIPIHFKGEIVSWTTRAIVDEGRRYVNALPEEEIMPTSHLLYGEDYVRHTVIVHEGFLDVWRTGPGAVATMTTSYSQAQVLRIAKYPTRVICFDNEPDAQRRASVLCDTLEAFPGETYRVVLSGKDASATDMQEIEELRKQFLT